MHDNWFKSSVNDYSQAVGKYSSIFSFLFLLDDSELDSVNDFYSNSFVGPFFWLLFLILFAVFLIACFFVVNFRCRRLHRFGKERAMSLDALSKDTTTMKVVEKSRVRVSISLIQRNHRHMV